MKRASKFLPVLLLLVGLLPTIRARAATLPDGVKTGASPQSAGSLATMAFPGIIGVNVAHNFVLDFSSGTKCWGSSGTGTFPQAASGNTTYTFAVTATPYDPASQNVACPGSGSISDLAMVQVLNTAPGAGRLQASIQDGGHGGQATLLTGLIADIFSASRLKLATSDSCGSGTVVSPHTMTVAAADYVTAIPTTSWSNCRQTLSLLLNSGTTVGTGTATGTLLLTMVSP